MELTWRASVVRVCMGRVQTIWNNAWYSSTRRVVRISKTSDSLFYTIYKSWSGPAWWEYSSRWRLACLLTTAFDWLSIIAAKLIGKEIYERISSAALKLYIQAAEYALTKGIIIADTKFEFGVVPSSTSESPLVVDGIPVEVILIDEVLTPDSSRFWPADTYEEGKPQASYDKQYLRDWLVKAGFRKGLEKGPIGADGVQQDGWKIDEDAVSGTQKRYELALNLLIGGSQNWKDHR